MTRSGSGQNYNIPKAQQTRALWAGLLATGRYQTFEPSTGVPVAVTVSRPKFPLRYELSDEVRRLAPWGLLDLSDQSDFVSRYRERLDQLDLDALVAKFAAISTRHEGRRLVLLCYEDVHAGQFCHRRVFADWWEERTGQPVPEVDVRPAQLRLDEAASACYSNDQGNDRSEQR